MYRQCICNIEHRSQYIKSLLAFNMLSFLLFTMYCRVTIVIIVLSITVTILAATYQWQIQDSIKGVPNL